MGEGGYYLGKKKRNVKMPVRSVLKLGEVKLSVERGNSDVRKGTSRVVCDEEANDGLSAENLAVDEEKTDERR